MTNPQKLLLVEDEEIVRMDLEATVQQFGYAVLGSFSRVEEALEFLAAQPQTSLPDAVLMDIYLGTGMDGIAGAAAIHERWQLPVVFLTAHADLSTLSRARAADPFAYVLKPFQDRELQMAIAIAIARHEAEKNLKLAVEKERELRRLKSRFLSTAIHDIRIPLSTIVLATDLLEMSLTENLSQRQVERFHKIRLATKTIQQFLDDVLELDRLESEQLAFRPQPLDVLQWCTDLIDEIRLSVGDAYTIAFSYEGEAKSAEIDAILLQRILSNLLSNAIKYSPKHSMVSLHVVFAEDCVVFQVTDRGIGIPPEMQAKLFQPFQRAQNVGRTPGTGLGLSIVKTCVDLHQGSIQVTSVLGGGTQFTVLLPLVPTTAALAESCIGLG